MQRGLRGGGVGTSNTALVALSLCSDSCVAAWPCAATASALMRHLHDTGHSQQ
jgi:hypothetical protein